MEDEQAEEYFVIKIDDPAGGKPHFRICCVVASIGGDESASQEGALADNVVARYLEEKFSASPTPGYPALSWSFPEIGMQFAGSAVGATHTRIARMAGTINPRSNARSVANPSSDGDEPAA